jgi:hypothetical protein
MNTGTSLIYKPFLREEYSDPEILESLPVKNPATVQPDAAPAAVLNIIEEREGVHYVSQAALDSSPNSEKDLDLNQDFKDLVNSIIN